MTETTAPDTTTSTDGQILAALLAAGMEGPDTRAIIARKVVRALRTVDQETTEEDLAAALATALDSAALAGVITSLEQVATWQDPRPATDPLRAADELGAAAKALATTTKDPARLHNLDDFNTVTDALSITLRALPWVLANLSDWMTVARSQRIITADERPRAANLPLILGALQHNITRALITVKDAADATDGIRLRTTLLADRKPQ